MKRKLAILSRSAEAIGLLCGLLMICAWKAVPAFLETPAWALLALVLIAMLAGWVVGARAGLDREMPHPAVRRGTRAAFYAVLMAGALFVLMARMIPGAAAPWGALIIAGASSVAATFAGSIAATVAMLIYQRRTEVSDCTALVLASEAGAGQVSDVATLPKWVRWLLIGLIGCVLSAGLVAPLFPTPLPPPPPPPPRPQAPPPEKPYTPPPFTYTTPEALKTAPPIAWKVLTRRDLGSLNTSAGVELSANQKVVVALEGDSTVVAQHLEKEETARVGKTPSPIKRIALSPDARRVFVVMANDPLRIGVADLASQRFIPLPQPKKHAVPEGQIVWWKEKQILFVTSEIDRWALDLDSLELDRVSLSEDENKAIAAKLNPPLPTTEAWQFFREALELTTAELPETEGTPNWPWRGREVLRLADKVHRQSRLFSEIDTRYSDFLLGVADGSKLLRFRNDALQVFYFDTRPIPPLRWKLTMPHAPEKMKEKDTAASALAMGDLSLVLYAPLTNPLTQKTIGPDRERPKSILRFHKWEGTEADVFVATDNLPYSPGDVLADVHVMVGGKEPRLLSLDTPHRWWMLAPEPLPDASDIAKLPTVAENEKRRAEATVAAEKAAKESQAALAKEAAESFKKPEPKPVVSTSGKFTPDGQLTPQVYAMGITDEDKARVLTFLLSHHEKVTQRQIREAVQDYADEAEFFSDGKLSRDAIFDKESKYHADFSSVTETVRKDSLSISPHRGNGMDVTYLIDSVRTPLSGTVKRSTHKITLWIVNAPYTFRIRKHTAEAVK
jgi:hypothetical protein